MVEKHHLALNGNRPSVQNGKKAARAEAQKPAASRQPDSKECYEDLLQTMGAILFNTDDKLMTTQVSPAAETLLGISPLKIIGKSFLDLIHTDDRFRVEQTFGRALKGLEQTTEFRIHSHNNRYRWFRGSLVPNLEGMQTTGVNGLLVDIDDRKKTEEELTGREEHYRNIIESIQEGYFEADLKGYITFCNQALINLSGYSKRELMGISFRELTPPRLARAMQIIFGRVYQTGQDVRLNKFEVYHKDGYTLFIDFFASLVKDRNGEPLGFRGILRDVSEQVKAMEQQQRMHYQLSQAQKMEALGTLAGGLAHGFNNVLMAIQGNLSLIRMTLPGDHSLQRLLERINRSTDKGVNLAKQILSFAKMGKFVVMTTNLNKILKSTSRMFVRSKPNLRIHENYEPELWNTQVDRVQIGQLLLTLYMNAAEAMPDGGDIYLQSENIVLDENHTRAQDIEPGRFVKISVTDTGKGLDEEAKQRIFEPFYSIHGTAGYDGLGLAAVYGTIKSHKGIINVYSEKGHGTTFTLYLPASLRDFNQDLDKKEASKGSETILLVDDDELAGRIGREILERHGYRIMMAHNGNEAIEIYTDYNHQIDLILLDIILPDINGEQVFQILKQVNPNAVIIVSSGYNVNKQISALMSQGCADFVQKPFQNRLLSSKIRTALDHAKPSPELPPNPDPNIAKSKGFR
jgi:PAS domain S-box-containing protein